MKKILAVSLVLLMTGSVALADSLRVNIDVLGPSRPAEIVAADIYVNMDGKLTEIAITPDGNVPFKMNLKAGALRIKSFWHTRAQINSKDVEPEVKEAK